MAYFSRAGGDALSQKTFVLVNETLKDAFLCCGGVESFHIESAQTFDIDGLTILFLGVRLG